MLRVREFSEEEGQALGSLVKLSSDPNVVQRAMIVLQTMQGCSPPKVSGAVPRGEGRVRPVIKDHNRSGRDMLYPKKPPGASRSPLPSYTRAL